MKKFVLLLLILASSALCFTAEFENLFAAPAIDLWQSNAAGLSKRLGVTLQQGDREGSIFRYYGRKSREQLTVAGIGIQELIANQKDGRIDELEISVHNRGDAPGMPLQTFRDDRKKLESFVASGIEGEPQHDRARLGGATIEMRYGRSKQALWVLTWCENGDKGEYLTLRLLPPDRQPERLKSSLRVSTANRNLADALVKEANGDCYLPVPMIDQGGKGYCAAATVARIMRFYGAELDQNTIAQLAATDADRGTSLAKLVSSLEQAQARLKIRVEPLITVRYFENANGVMQYISEYNNAARKEKAPQVKLEDFVVSSGGVRTIMMDKVYSIPDPGVVAKLRMRDRSGFKKFNETIVKAINQGYPVIWCIPSHMRIINGYNLADNTIIYTDSYGAGHEKKSMSSADAWAQTVRTMVLEPTR